MKNEYVSMAMILSQVSKMFRTLLLLTLILTTCCDGSEETTAEDIELEQHHHIIPEVKVPLPLDDHNPHKPLGSGGK